jgi:molybdopterin-guanine dinucleotide biosynthesis protein MobB
VGSVKHHSHDKFDIDYPGKDSYRHRAAGASETVIASPVKLARIKTLEHEAECLDIVLSMPGHDIIIVEGYRKSGLPTIEIMRSGNAADVAVAAEFVKCARAGVDLSTDFIQIGKTQNPEGFVGYDAHKVCDGAHVKDLQEKMPTSQTMAVVTDIPDAIEAAKIFGIPAFALDDISGIADFLDAHFVRPRVTVVIQAGGESRRMGQSKATVPFRGRPLIKHMVERLASAADEFIITTNEPQNLAFLHEDYSELNIKLVTDDFDFRGALPGLHTALNAASNPFVAVVACDMVFASAPLVLAEAYEMAKSDADIVVPVNSHGYEPFHAMYRKHACLSGVKRALEADCSRVQCLFDDPEISVVEFSQEAVLRVEPRGGCFINANTPEELAHLEANYLGN